ncbi:MAG: RNA polymerase sigma factor [Mediterranea sp.]|jgi:RNA polymerase sigma-70 factor (ECF subfamily)|nr:RNA polymerase sigma factor [Mediterranea sp.]
MDAATFKLQFLPCHRKLFQVAYRFMGNAQDAEDMVQEAYLKLWSKRDQLDEVQNAEAYSVVILKNLCFDVLRRTQLEGDNHSPEELSLPTDTDQATELERRDEVDCVKQLIKQLPKQQQLVMTLRDVNDYSFEEIQQATGLNAINIRALLSRARKKIREQFNAIGRNERK